MSGEKLTKGLPYIYHGNPVYGLLKYLAFFCRQANILNARFGCTFC